MCQQMDGLSNPLGATGQRDDSVGVDWQLSVSIKSRDENCKSDQRTTAAHERTAVSRKIRQASGSNGCFVSTIGRQTVAGEFAPRNFCRYLPSMPGIIVKPLFSPTPANGEIRSNETSCR
jgi:hypothetical protein